MAARHRILNIIWSSNPSPVLASFALVEGGASKVERKFSGLQKAGAVAMAGLALGAVALGAKSVQAYLDFDDAMTKSLAIMSDVSPKMRKQMEETAKSVSTTTTFSSKEAAGAYYELASAGLTAEQSMKALPTVANFAQAGLMDLGTATDYLTQAQGALGLRFEDPIKNMEEMIHVSDVLTKANNIAQGSVEDFAEALSAKAAGALRIAGKSIEEGTAVIAAFHQQGVLGSKAGEALARMLRDIPRAAARNSDEFARMNIHVFDASGNLKNMADVVGEFERVLGPMSDAERAAALDTLGLTRTVGDNIKTMVGMSGTIRENQTSLEDWGGATETVANKQLEGLKNQLKILGNKFENFMIKIGKPIATWLVDEFVPWLEGPFARAVSDAAKSFEKDILPKIEDFAGLVDDYIISPLKDFAKFLSDHDMADDAVFLAGALVTLTVALKGVSAVATALGPAIGLLQGLAGVLGTIAGITGGAALLAVGVALDTIVNVANRMKEFNWDEFTAALHEAMSERMDQSAELLGKAWDWAFEIGRWVVKGLWDGIKAGANWLWTKLIEFKDRVIADFKKLFGIQSPATTMIPIGIDIVKGIASGIVQAIPEIGTAIRQIPGRILEFAGDAGNWLFTTGLDMARGAGNGIRAGWQGIQGAWDGVLNITRGVMNNIGNVVRGAVQTVQNIFMGGVHVVQNIWNTGWNIVKGISSGALEAIRVRVQGGIDTVKNILSGAWQTIQNTATGAWNNVKNIIIGALNGVKNTIGGIWDKIYGVFKSGVNKVRGPINTLIDGLNNIVKRIPGVNITFPKIPELAMGGQVGGGAGGKVKVFARGTNAMPATDLGKTGPFVTSGARAIVGEGNPAHPEFVIPTDPKFRGRALSLFQALGTKLMAKGGTIPQFDNGTYAIPTYIVMRESGGNYKAENPTSTASGAYQFVDGTWDNYGGYHHASDAPPHIQDQKAAQVWDGGRGWRHWKTTADVSGGFNPGDVIGAIGNVLGEMRKGMVNAAFAPLDLAFNNTIGQVPIEFIREGARMVKDQIKNWLKGVDEGLPDGSKGMGGVSGGAIPAGAGPGPGGTFEPLASRLQKLMNAIPGLQIISGFRSRAQQQSLYDRYLSGNGNLAAPPGNSNHERGLAADLGPRSLLPRAHALAGQFGLHWPVRGEDWHIQAARDGIWNVPSNGFPVLAHKGETILPKDEAANYRDGLAGSGGRGGITIENVSVHGGDADGAVKKLSDELGWLWRVS